MKHFIILILIISFMFIGCSKQSDPFAPQVNNSNTPVTHVTTLVPETLAVNLGSVNDSRFGVCLSSKSPYIVDYKVYASWDGAMPFEFWEEYIITETMLHDQNPYQNYNGLLYFNVNEEFTINNQGDGIAPTYTPNSVFLSGIDEKYEYTATGVSLYLIDGSVPQDMYKERFYKYYAYDMYGRETGLRTASVKYARVQLGLMSYDAHSQGFMWDLNNYSYCRRIGLGEVVAINGNIYTIKMHFSECDLCELSQWYQDWCVYKVYIEDYSGNSEEMPASNPGEEKIISIKYTGTGDGHDGDDGGDDE